MSFLLSCNKHKDYSILKVDKHLIQLDTIKLKDTIIKRIKLANIGKEKLHLLKIEANCGCTIVDFKDSILNPNEFTFLNIRIIPENKGLFKKNVVIKSNTEDIFTIIDILGQVN